jgi:hypothetical protein
MLADGFFLRRRCNGWRKLISYSLIQGNTLVLFVRRYHPTAQASEQWVGEVASVTLLVLVLW